MFCNQTFTEQTLGPYQLKNMYVSRQWSCISTIITHSSLNLSIFSLRLAARKIYRIIQNQKEQDSWNTLSVIFFVDQQQSSCIIWHEWSGILPSNLLLDTTTRYKFVFNLSNFLHQGHLSIVEINVVFKPRLG